MTAKKVSNKVKGFIEFEVDASDVENFKQDAALNGICYVLDDWVQDNITKFMIKIPPTLIETELDLLKIAG
mgnify:CR=1 FL=1